MKILSETDGIFVKRDDGTEIRYFIFDEYEIHENVLPPNTTQLWHYHTAVEEVIYIYSGRMAVYWKNGDSTEQETVVPGNIVRVENTPHTFANSSSEPCVFIVFRFIPTGVPNQHLIKKDKVLCEI